MTTTDREDMFRRERGKALVRALHLGELQAAGAKRALALDEAEEQLDRIARLLPDALHGGLTMTEISRVTGISRPTLYELKARYGDSVGDLRLAVLQSIALKASTSGEIADRLKRDHSDVGSAIGEYQRNELVDFEPVELEDGEDLEYSLTLKGLETLEHWQFEDEQSSEADGSTEVGK
jgi:DNA-binding MarR family transcriptional regulator